MFILGTFEGPYDVTLGSSKHGAQAPANASLAKCQSRCFCEIAGFLTQPTLLHKLNKVSPQMHKCLSFNNNANRSSRPQSCRTKHKALSLWSINVSLSLWSINVCDSISYYSSLIYCSISMHNWMYFRSIFHFQRRAFYIWRMACEPETLQLDIIGLESKAVASSPLSCLLLF